jgi:hypothetical protein
MEDVPVLLAQRLMRKLQIARMYIVRLRSVSKASNLQGLLFPPFLR